MANQRWALPLVLLAAIAAYVPTLWFPLVWDDPGIAAYVTDVVRERGLGGLARAEFQLDAQSTEHLGYYRPVVLLSFYFDALLSRLVPQSYHLTNVLLHALNAALVYLLARAALGVGWGALFGGLLFALHPVHIESVAFVSGRTDLWAALFVLLAALSWLSNRASERPRRALDLAGAGAFLLAVLSKEVALLLPAALLLWDALGFGAGGRGRGGWLERNRSWVGAWTLAVAAALVLRIAVAGVGFGTAQTETWLAEVRAQPAYGVRIWLTYLRLLIVPWPLSPYYMPQDLDRWLPGLAGGVGLLGLCLFAAQRKAGKIGLPGLAWIVVFLFPVSGVVPLAGAIVAERFLYLPSIGLCLAAGGLAGWAAGSARLRPIAIGGGALLLTVAFTGVVVRSGIWKDEFTLYRETVRSSPSSPAAHLNLGKAWDAGGRPDEALREYAVAARLAPKFADAYAAQGETFVKLGRPMEAVPQFVAALRLKEESPEAHYNLAVAYLALDRNEDAARESRRALELRPAYALAANNLGVACSLLGRHEEAAAAFRRSLQSDPSCAGCSYNLGLEYAALGRWPDAAAAYAEALRLEPANPAMRLELGRAWVRMGRIALAEAERRRLQEIDARAAAAALREIIAGH